MTDKVSGVGLEIGGGTSPNLWLLRPDLIQGKTQVYIEKKSKANEDSLPIDYIKGQTRNQFILGADGSKLPFGNESVDIVFAKDVLGEPTQTSSVNEKFDQMIKEMARVVSPHGKIIIVEMATPVDRNILDEKFKRLGFSEVESYSGNNIGKIYFDEDLHKIKRERKDAYAIIFQKV